MGRLGLPDPIRDEDIYPGERAEVSDRRQSSTEDVSPAASAYRREGEGSTDKSESHSPSSHTEKDA